MSNRKMSSSMRISPEALKLLGDLKADINLAARSAPGDVDQVRSALKGFAVVDGGKDAVKQATVGLNYNDCGVSPYRDGWDQPSPNPYRDGGGSPYRDGWTRHRP